MAGLKVGNDLKMQNFGFDFIHTISNAVYVFN